MSTYGVDDVTPRGIVKCALTEKHENIHTSTEVFKITVLNKTVILNTSVLFSAPFVALTGEEEYTTI